MKMMSKALQLFVFLQCFVEIRTHNYIFAIQWGESVCRNDKDCKPENVNPTMWTIHGLWPLVQLPASPISKPFDLNALGADLRKQLHNSWPSVVKRTSESFWEHEWNEHGTKAIRDTSSGIHNQTRYFSVAVDMLRQFNLYRTFERCNIFPNDATYKAQKFIDCLRKEARIMPKQYTFRTQIKKINGVNQLVLLEIRLCFKGTNIATNRVLSDCGQPEENGSRNLLYPETQNVAPRPSTSRSSEPRAGTGWTHVTIALGAAVTASIAARRNL